jgi:hypothetical protein
MRKRGADESESTINGSIAAGIVEEWWSIWVRVEDIWNAGDDKKILVVFDTFYRLRGGRRGS